MTLLHVLVLHFVNDADRWGLHEYYKACYLLAFYAACPACMWRLHLLPEHAAQHRSTKLGKLVHCVMGTAVRQVTHHDMNTPVSHTQIGLWGSKNREIEPLGHSSFVSELQLAVTGNMYRADGDKGRDNKNALSACRLARAPRPWVCIIM